MVRGDNGGHPVAIHENRQHCAARVIHPRAQGDAWGVKYEACRKAGSYTRNRMRENGWRESKDKVRAQKAT